MHPGRVAQRHARLMAALGYDRYLAQGGDWGSPITHLLAQQDPDHCRAVHINVAQPLPPADVADPMALVAEHEKPWLEDNARHQQEGTGYFYQQTTRPQTLAYGLADSPAALCAWIAEKFHFWCDCEANGKRDIRNAVSWDRLLTNVSLYWFTNSIASSVRLYREFVLALGTGRIIMPFKVPVPVGMATYPRELYKTPRAWAEGLFRLVHWFEAKRVATSPPWSSRGSSWRTCGLSGRRWCPIGLRLPPDRCAPGIPAGNASLQRTAACAAASSATDSAGSRRLGRESAMRKPTMQLSAT